MVMQIGQLLGGLAMGAIQSRGAKGRSLGGVSSRGVGMPGGRGLAGGMGALGQGLLSGFSGQQGFPGMGVTAGNGGGKGRRPVGYSWQSATGTHTKVGPNSYLYQGSNGVERRYRMRRNIVISSDPRLSHLRKLQRVEKQVGKLVRKYAPRARSGGRRKK